MSPGTLRSTLERLVTGQTYFRQPHAAEPDPHDPLRSYYFDLRGRAAYPGAMDKRLPVVNYGDLSFVNPVNAAQYGLAHLQRYWDTGQESCLASAGRVAGDLVHAGTEENDGLLWRYPVPVKGSTGWLSAMAQGQAASLLLRVGSLVGEEWYLSKARMALNPFLHGIPDGGVQTRLNGNMWFEEYSISPPPYTLNGFVVSLFGVRDAALLLDEPIYNDLFEEGIATLEESLTLFDVDGWSRYDLTEARMGPLTLPHFASPFYHRFHIELLGILEILVSGKVFDSQRNVWAESLGRGPIFYRALLGKSFYRLATPEVKPSS